MENEVAKKEIEWKGELTVPVTTTPAESRLRFYSHLKQYRCNGKCPYCEKLHNYWDEVKPKPGEIGRVFCPEHKYLRYGDNEGDGYTKDRKKPRRASA